MELVSVIVPIYQVEAYLEKCVQSIRNQTYSELEIILVDDGSPDRCGAICDHYAEEDGRIRVIHKCNGGLADARNAGMQEAHGQYVLFVDSDDWIHKKLIQRTVETAEKYEADIVFFDYAGVEEGKRKKEIFTADVPQRCVLSAEKEPRLVMCSCSAVNKLYRRSFWDKTGICFPTGRHYEDLGTVPKVMGLAGRIVYQKEVLYYYRMRNGSIMHSTDFKKNFTDRTEVTDGVLAFYKEHGLWEKYRDELEYLVFENTYFVPSKEIVLADRKSLYLEKFKDYAYSRFPDIDQNKYIGNLSGKNKILYFLLKKKLYSLMALMSYMRRAKDYVKTKLGGNGHGIGQHSGSDL